MTDETVISTFRELLAETMSSKEKRDKEADVRFARVRIASELIRRGEDPSSAVMTAKVLADELLTP